MVAPFSTVGGYGGNPSLAVDPITGLSAMLADALDGFPVLAPALTAAGTGLIALSVNPFPILPNSGLPELNAILVELRVISALLREQMGNMAGSFDLQTMRADEAWNTNPTTGSL